jgi:hypothetical protein
MVGTPGMIKATASLLMIWLGIRESVINLWGTVLPYTLQSFDGGEAHDMVVSHDVIFTFMLQFALLGVVEILLGVAQLRFLYRETPDSMRSLAISLTFTTIAIG